MNILLTGNNSQAVFEGLKGLFLQHYGRTPGLKEGIENETHFGYLDPFDLNPINIQVLDSIDQTTDFAHITHRITCNAPDSICIETPAYPESAPILIRPSKKEDSCAEARLFNRLFKNSMDICSLFDKTSNTDKSICLAFQQLLEDPRLGFLTPEKFNQFCSEAPLLAQILANKDSLAKDKINAIEQFTHRMKGIAGGKFRSTLAALFTVFLTAVATVVIAAALFAAGFGIGLAAGLWTGPASFLTGVLSGAAAASNTFWVCAALAAVISAVVGRVFTQNEGKIYSFFQPSPALQMIQPPLDRFSTQAELLIKG
ncbi:MAG: hypothetical protein WC785_05540 [Tatlockia sp.]|jgi:hypothetical protein